MVWVLILFTGWSHSFIAIEYLLGGADGAPRLTWYGLLLVRFAPVTLLCLAYCFLHRRRDSMALLRAHWRRILVASFFSLWAYNAALYFGQSREVPAPIASLLTAVSPLSLMLISAMFLGERLTFRKCGGFGLALAGLTLIAMARESTTSGDSYALMVLITAAAPIGWSIYSALSKPMSGRVDPLLWTFLVLGVGGLPTLLLLPLFSMEETLALDGRGWAFVAFLALFCTVIGYAIWGWLLKHLPASTVGFTVFLNPPMTTGFKLLWATLFPALTFRVGGLEIVGGLVVLGGLAMAVLPPRRRLADGMRPARSFTRWFKA